MNKKKFLELIAKRNQRKAALGEQAKTCEDVATLRSINAELEALDAEIRELQEMADSIPDTDPNDPDGRTAAVTGQIPGIVAASAAGQEKRTASEEVEQRVQQAAADLRSGKEITVTAEMQSFMEKRAVATTDVMLENKYKQQIKDNFNEVAQTIDLVDAFTLDGGKSYEVAFQITDGDAEYTAEGETFTNSEGTFGTASTGYAKITNSAIVNEEVVELPNADYLSRIVNSVRKSIRKKLSGQIISGAGTANTIKGIYNAPATTIPASYKVELEKIDEDSLRKIVFSYGGSEDVESPATLFLNKLDLAEFASVKAAGDGRSYYKITYNGSNGFIEEFTGGLRVPYTINSECVALSGAATEVGAKTMVYGPPDAYELPMFTPLTIKRSDERYIDQGKVGFFGKVHCGGVVNKYKGFICVTKKEA